MYLFRTPCNSSLSFKAHPPKIVVCFFTFSFSLIWSSHSAPLGTLLLWTWFLLCNVLGLFLYFHFIQLLHELEIILWTLLLLAFATPQLTVVTFSEQTVPSFPFSFVPWTMNCRQECIDRGNHSPQQPRDMKDRYEHSTVQKPQKGKTERPDRRQWPRQCTLHFVHLTFCLFLVALPGLGSSWTA